MKNFLAALFTLCLLVPTIASGQFEIRPMIGTTLNSIKDSRNADFQGKFDFNFGVDLMIGGQVYVQPGLHYVGTTSRLKPGEVINGEPTDIAVDRLEIPVLLGYRFSDPEISKLTNLRVFTGPSLLFVTNVDDSGSIFNISETDFNNITLGWNAGAGLDILFFYVDAGYQFGLSKAFDDLELDGYTVKNTTNNFWYLNAGIRLKI